MISRPYLYSAISEHCLESVVKYFLRISWKIKSASSFLAFSLKFSIFMRRVLHELPTSQSLTAQLLDKRNRLDSP